MFICSFYLFFKLDEVREKFEDLKLDSEEKIREHIEKVCLYAMRIS